MKIHIFISPDPPRYGTKLIALCGDKVPSAVSVPIAANQPTNSILFCKRCQQLGRYFAWIVSGEEGKQLEAGEIE